MQKVTIFMVSLLVLAGAASFSPAKTDKINWLTPAQLEAAYKQKPKPILVDVYTDWCGWCKVMDRETYSNKKVIAYINEHYYAVKFNAESKDSVTFGAKKYGYKPEYKSNELALYLLYGNMSFPTTVFLSGIDAQPAPIPGYMKPGELESPLKYFGDGAFATQNFPDFMKSFKGEW